MTETKNVVDTAAEFLRSGMPFRDAVNTALDNHSFFEEGARASAYRRVCAELQRRSTLARAKRKRLQEAVNLF